MRWPIAIACGFAVMVTMNAVFIYIAVSGADPVSADWRVEENRR